MRHLLYYVIALWTVCVVVSCIDRPDYVLDEPMMIDVLVDVHRAEGLLEIQQQHSKHPDETEQYQREVIAAVLQKHNVTRVQYDSSLMWYAQHLKLLTRVYSHVDQRLQDEHESWSLQVAEAKTFASSAAGDTVDLWTLRRHLVLDERHHTDARFWEVPSDSNFLVGDTLRWHFNVHQLLPSQRLIASMSLTAPKAENPRGGIPVIARQSPLGSAGLVISAPGHYVLTLYADSLEAFGSAMLGLVLMQDTTCHGPVFADSISLIRTHVAHEEPSE